MRVAMECDQQLQEIRVAIDEAMDSVNKMELEFVTKDKLLEIWKRNSNLESFCCMVNKAGSDDASCATADKLERFLLRTMSILVYIHWTDWNQFNALFLQNQDFLDHTDRKLKSCKEVELGSLLGSKYWARAFLRIREAFFPVLIKERKIQKYDPKRRLPFLYPEDGSSIEVGRGAFGKVTKEVIAPRRYRLHNGNILEKCVVARKVILHGNLEMEKNNLVLLNSSLTKHRNIVPFLAIVSLGTEINILSEFAEMNLAYFLKTAWSTPVISEKITTSRLFNEFTGIADALSFLHKGLYIPPEDRSKTTLAGQQGLLFCCHMDLKPENILIYKDKDHPLGHWKISDFGISKFKEIQIAKKSGYRSSYFELLGGSEGGLNTVLTQAGRYHGTWTAPEFETSPEEISTKSDVWSLGCIFVLVCALSISSDNLSKLESCRGKTCESNSNTHTTQYSHDAFYRVDTSGVILNPNIKTWADQLPIQKGNNIDNKYFLEKCRDLVFKSLEIDYKKRIDAEGFRHSLDLMLTSGSGRGNTESHTSPSSHSRPSIAIHDGSFESRGETPAILVSLRSAGDPSINPSLTPPSIHINDSTFHTQPPSQDLYAALEPSRSYSNFENDHVADPRTNKGPAMRGSTLEKPLNNHIERMSPSIVNPDRSDVCKSNVDGLFNNLHYPTSKYIDDLRRASNSQNIETAIQGRVKMLWLASELRSWVMQRQTPVLQITSLQDENMEEVLACVSAQLVQSLRRSPKERPMVALYHFCDSNTEDDIRPVLMLVCNLLRQLLQATGGEIPRVTRERLISTDLNILLLAFEEVVKYSVAKSDIFCVIDNLQTYLTQKRFNVTMEAVSLIVRLAYSLKSTTSSFKLLLTVAGSGLGSEAATYCGVDYHDVFEFDVGLDDDWQGIESAFFLENDMIWN